MRLREIITLLPLCLTACLHLQPDGDAQCEANEIDPCIEALESIAGDFDGDGESERATIYHIAEQTIPGDSITPEQHIDESYYIAFDKESIARKTSPYRMSNLTLLGDVNSDGKINEYDYILVARAILGTYTLSDEQKVLSDINKDGVINEYDYILIARHHFGTYVIE